MSFNLPIIIDYFLITIVPLITRACIFLVLPVKLNIDIRHLYGQPQS